VTINRLQELANTAIFEPSRGVPSTPGVRYRGRGVYEAPFQRIPGKRLFVALSCESVEVYEAHMAPGGDEDHVRRMLAERLVDWECGTGFLRVG
jgi:hypothetical protein